jgi:hypothetical protein
VHLLQPVRDDLEGLAETLIERGLQLFVDRCAHLVELRRVVVPERVEPLFDGHAHRLEALFVGQREDRQLLTESLQLPLLQSRRVGELLLRHRAEAADRLTHLGAQSHRRRALLGTRVRQVLPDVPLGVRNLRVERVKLRAKVGCVAYGVVAHA